MSALLLMGGAAAASPLHEERVLPRSAPLALTTVPAQAGDWTPLALVVESRSLRAADRLRRDEEPKLSGGGKKALLLSLLLPGAGEMSLGEHGRATGFFIAEGAIWTHFVWFQVAGHLRKDNYIDQAQRHAGVGVSSADDTYWKLVGQYETSSGTGPDAYEESLRREARDQFPGDPAAQDAWVAERLPSGDRAWSWSSPDSRATYRETRESSRRAYDRSKYSIAAAIANRLLSAIDTQIIRRKHSHDAHSDAGSIPLLLLADTAPDGSGRLYLTRSF